MKARDVLAIWEEYHGELAEDHRAIFLGRDELPQIMRYSRFIVNEVVSENMKLVDIVRVLQEEWTTPDGNVASKDVAGPPGRTKTSGSKEGFGRPIYPDEYDAPPLRF